MNEAVFLALQLASAGFCNGNPQTILYDIDASLVIDMLQFQHFKSDFENAAYKLNSDAEQ